MARLERKLPAPAHSTKMAQLVRAQAVKAGRCVCRSRLFESLTDAHRLAPIARCLRMAEDGPLERSPQGPRVISDGGERSVDASRCLAHA